MRLGERQVELRQLSDDVTPLVALNVDGEDHLTIDRDEAFKLAVELLRAVGYECFIVDTYPPKLAAEVRR